MKSLAPWGYAVWGIVLGSGLACSAGSPDAKGSGAQSGTSGVSAGAGAGVSSGVSVSSGMSAGSSGSAMSGGGSDDAGNVGPDARADGAGTMPVADAGSAKDASMSPEGGSTSCSAAQVGPDGDFKGYRMFPANHPINTRIDTLPVSAQSANWLANCSPSAPHLQVDPSMPYNIVAASTPPVTATKLDYNSTPYPNPWPFPASAVIEGGDPTTPGDHHCLAFNVGNCGLYEVYNILWSADKKSFTAASGTVWDTTTNAPGNGSGSDAAGLPIIPLLFRYDELVGAGVIPHALRFTCAASEQGHIAPARASASSSQGSGVPSNPHDPTFPPMGMRVRLKGSYDPTAHAFPPIIVTLLVTLQRYGIILADNGGRNSPMFITGASDQALQDALSDPAYLLKQITITDLEVVDTGPVTQD